MLALHEMKKKMIDLPLLVLPLLPGKRCRAAHLGNSAQGVPMLLLLHLTLSQQRCRLLFPLMLLTLLSLLLPPVSLYRRPRQRPHDELLGRRLRHRECPPGRDDDEGLLVAAPALDEVDVAQEFDGPGGFDDGAADGHAEFEDPALLAC